MVADVGRGAARPRGDRVPRPHRLRASQAYRPGGARAGRRRADRFAVAVRLSVMTEPPRGTPAMEPLAEALAGLDAGPLPLRAGCAPSDRHANPPLSRWLRPWAGVAALVSTEVRVCALAPVLQRLLDPVVAVSRRRESLRGPTSPGARGRHRCSHSRRGPFRASPLPAGTKPVLHLPTLIEMDGRMGNAYRAPVRPLGRLDPPLFASGHFHTERTNP